MVFTRISATELVRRLGDVLGRIRYRGESFLIERSGTPVARMTPLPDSSQVSLRDALAAWATAGPPDPEFAELLEHLGGLDRPPETSWES